MAETTARRVGALRWTGFFYETGDPKNPKTYLMYLNRTRANSLGGSFNGIKHHIIAGKMRDGLQQNLEAVRARLQGEYQR